VLVAPLPVDRDRRGSRWQQREAGRGRAGHLPRSAVRAHVRTRIRIPPGGLAHAGRDRLRGDATEELVGWASAQTGGSPRVCQTCDASTATARNGTPRHRTPASALAKARTLRETFTGVPVRIEIERLDGGPALVIVGAQWLAELFFRLDASAVGQGSYDARVAVTPKNRFDDEDITAVNRTMATHASHIWWSDLLKLEAPEWLADLDPAWDLYKLSDEIWQAAGVSERLARALAAMDAKHRKLAVITKVLHLKRPALVPVLDSLVVDQLGARGNDPVRVIEHVRGLGRRNLDALLEVQRHLAEKTGEDGQPIGRTLVRITDALLWTAHPGSTLHPLLLDWRTELKLPRQEYVAHG
jgi:Family of unknown function (DUF6308)